MQTETTPQLGPFARFVLSRFGGVVLVVIATAPFVFGAWLMLGPSGIAGHFMDQQYAEAHTVPTDHYFCQYGPSVRSDGMIVNGRTFVAKTIPQGAIEFGSMMVSSDDPRPVCFHQDAAGHELDLFCAPNHQARYYDVYTADGERYYPFVPSERCVPNPAAGVQPVVDG